MRLLRVRVLQQMQGTDRGGRYGGCSSDLRGLHSEEQLFLSEGEVEVRSRVSSISVEEPEHGRSEEEQGRF